MIGTALAWLSTAGAKPLVKYGLPVLLIVLAALAFWLWLGDVKDDARQEGVTKERVGGLEQTVNRMEQANDTRQQIRDDRSRARYDECMRSARNPENCKRFLPE